MERRGIRGVVEEHRDAQVMNHGHASAANCWPAPLLETHLTQLTLALIRGLAGQPSGFFECTVELRLYCGRTRRPISQSSGEAVLRSRSGRRFNVQAIDPDGGTSKEFVLLYICVSPYNHGLDLDIEITLRSEGRKERDRARRVASELVLQNGDDPGSTGRTLHVQDRTCHLVAGAARDE